MKRNTMLFVLAAATLCAVDTYAQAPNSGQAQSAPAAAPAAAPKKTPEQKKAEWQAGVKADCSAEIADGGVCAGKDFATGLEKCLHENRKTLSAGCKVAVRPRKATKAKKPAADSAPAATPAATPQQ